MSTDEDKLARHLGFLDWPEVILRLAERADSEHGRAACRALPLAQSRAEALALMAEVTEMVGLLVARANPPPLGFPDIEAHLDAVEKGAALGADELRQIATFCEVGQGARRFFANLADASGATPGASGLIHIAAALGTHEHLIEVARETFDAAGGIRDSASPDLFRLRRERDQLAGRARGEAERLLRSPTFAPYLQDEFVTLRADRFVLPLKASFKSMGLGIVHDTSGSGETVFLEPAAMVELNNRLKVVEIDIRRECRRILEDLAATVAGSAESLRADRAVLSRLDVIAAKARLAQDTGATPVELDDGAVLDLRGLRHPLLALHRREARRPVVENDVVLGEVPGRSGARVLVISGPNAGGKTVLLKAVGLAALMVRAGMHVVAAPGTRVGFFHHVLADIGDQQSVMGDLSTFSAHLANLAGIIEAATAAGSDNVLALLDELMAGTHPDQGAALARATLERLADLPGLVITTTHYDSLKALTEGDARFRNAGMEYDLAALSPTFRLKDGLPGRSYALDIAARMGMPDGVLDRARELLGGSTLGLEEVLRGLEERAQTLARAEAALDDARLELERRAGEEHAAARKLVARERELALGARDEVEKAVRQAREAIAEVVAEARKARSVREISAASDKLDKTARAVQSGLPAHDPLTLDVSKLKEALAARALGVKSGPQGLAKVTRPQAVVAADPIPVMVLQSRANTCDLRGMRVDEALAKVEAYLDQSVLDGADAVFIIHGHGTGVLRKVVREYLATSHYVERFRAGGAGEGGDGVSVVTVRG